MRAIDCPCGHQLEGEDDEELFRLAREHVDRDHPEMQRSDEQIRERVAADAYELSGVGSTEPPRSGGVGFAGTGTDLTERSHVA